MQPPFPRAFGAGPLGAIVLTGGRSSRMGADKAAQLWAGRRAVDLVVDLARAVGAGAVVTAGAEGFGHPFAPDAEPYGGPAGGVLAGLRVLSSQACARVLVLAVDAPTIRPQDLAPLLQAESSAAAYEGLHLPLVMRAAAPEGTRSDWPLARLAECAGAVRLPCAPDAWARLRGANCPAERDALLAASAAATPQ